MSDELNARVAEIVGWQWYSELGADKNMLLPPESATMIRQEYLVRNPDLPDHPYRGPQFDTDLLAAWQVMSTLYRDGPYKTGWSPSIARQNDGQWVCTLHNHAEDEIPTGVAATAPLAICLAAVAAKENRETAEAGRE